MLHLKLLGVKKTFICGVLLIGMSMANASDFTYEHRKEKGHIIHIVALNPKVYRAEILRANKGTGGREAVSSMATGANVEVAINGGFFEIGFGKDGMPSGTLVINGHSYNLKNRQQSLLVIKSGVASILLSNPRGYLKKDISMVSGIPLLVHHNQIPKKLFEKNGKFYVKPHARTAIGTKPDDTIIVVVAEHNYKETEGLTILELATLMKKLGCKQALNLDGGGSSALWVKGKIVNHTVGDEDESDGLQIERPVSDAIVFKKNKYWEDKE